MSILTATRTASPQHPAHAPWCATPRIRRHTDGGACFSETFDTPIGAAWLSQTAAGPVIVADTRATLVMPLDAALAVVATLTSLLAEAAPLDGGDVPAPVAMDVVDVVASLSERAALQLVAALTARLAGAR